MLLLCSLPDKQYDLQERDADVKVALQAAQADLDWIVAEVKAGKLSHEEAEEYIKDISDSAPTVKAAAVAVTHAQSGGLHEQESAGLGNSSWSPQLHESVRLLKLGGRTGKVRYAHTAQTHVAFLCVDHMSCNLILACCYRDAVSSDPSAAEDAVLLFTNMLCCLWQSCGSIAAGFCATVACLQQS